MGFRLKAFGLHLLGSATALALILGLLYVGWYHWPGWFLADVTRVVLVMIGVDVVVGPLLTFVIANKNKQRRELKRDIGIIVAVQLIALIYGSASLWNGRPLYYGFSENVPLVVQAYDIESSDANEARRVNPELAPHWYSLPRWVWAPLPNEQKNGKETIDAMSMPKYFKPWDQGFPTLRSRLQKLSDWKFFSVAEKKSLEKRMQGAGLSIDQQNTIPLTGRGRPALIVFEPTTLKIVAILRSN